MDMQPGQTTTSITPDSYGLSRSTSVETDGNRTGNSAAKRKAESVISDEDSDYVDSDSEHTHAHADTSSRLRVATFFAVGS